MFTCYRKPFGERIRPHFSKFLLGTTPILEGSSAAAALEMGIHSTNRSRATHGQGRDRPSRNISVSDAQLSHLLIMLMAVFMTGHAMVIYPRIMQLGCGLALNFTRGLTNDIVIDHARSSIPYH